MKLVGQKLKVTLLLAMVFVLGGGTLVTMYATGEQVLDMNHIYMVSHTEYRYNETGQVVVRLVNSAGLPITVDNCTALILYPNKTIYLGPSLMTNTSAIAGDHYYSFTTPVNGPEGVYEYQATCTWNSGAKTESATNSFHLSSAFNTLQSSVDAVSTKVDAVNLSLSTDIANFRAEVQVNVTQILAAIENQTVEVNLTSVYANFTEVLANQAVMQSYLNQINSTTESTYAYMTGTLATNINTILGNLGVINATVNRIETNTVSINTTVNTILDNQNNEVYMSVYSG